MDWIDLAEDMGKVLWYFERCKDPLGIFKMWEYSVQIAEFLLASKQGLCFVE